MFLRVLKILLKKHLQAKTKIPIYCILGFKLVFVRKSYIVRAESFLIKRNFTYFISIRPENTQFNKKSY